jgi:hypothetical protein
MARVVSGQGTKVSFFNPSRKWDLTFNFVIGKGSDKAWQIATGMAAHRKVGNITDREPMFHIHLTPTQQKPASFPAPDWHPLATHGPPSITLPDVSPGHYRVRIGDFLGSIGFHGLLYETEIKVTNTRRSLRVPLGAGSVTGRVQWTADYRYMIHVLALSDKGETLRSARCDGDGDFCVRYLPKGKWTLCAHDYGAGWCRIGVVTVKNDTTDIGVHKLQLGGRLTGKVEMGNEERLADAVVATDALGFRIDDRGFSEGKRREFKISGLWPGQWTLKLMSGETVLATAKTELKGTETVRCDLVAAR